MQNLTNSFFTYKITEISVFVNFFCIETFKKKSLTKNKKLKKIRIIYKFPLNTISLQFFSDKIWLIIFINDF